MPDDDDWSETTGPLSDVTPRALANMIERALVTLCTTLHSQGASCPTIDAALTLAVPRLLIDTTDADTSLDLLIAAALWVARKKARGPDDVLLHYQQGYQRSLDALRAKGLVL